MKPVFGKREGPPQGEPISELTPEEEEELSELKKQLEALIAWMGEAGVTEDRIIRERYETQIAEIELRGLNLQLTRLKKEHPETDTTFLQKRITELELKLPPSDNGGEGNEGGRAA